MGRNHINVAIATIHALRLVILKNTCEHIVVRNLTNVTSVTMPALPPVILGDTKKLTKKGAKLMNQRMLQQQKQSTPATSIGVQCNKCTYFCLTPDTYVKAKEIDSRQKKYTCELCRYVCFQPGTLKRHFKTHKGDKNFKCVQCGRYYSKAEHLVRHTKRCTEVLDKLLTKLQHPNL